LRNYAQQPAGAADHTGERIRGKTFQQLLAAVAAVAVICLLLLDWIEIPRLARGRAKSRRFALVRPGIQRHKAGYHDRQIQYLNSTSILYTRN
jgi:hypothetical protein